MVKKNTQTKTDIGLIGLGVMGQNIARNIEDKGFKISVFNRNEQVTKQFIKKYGTPDMVPAFDYKSFVFSIKKPRKIFIMVTAGQAVDAVIGELSKHVDKGDVIIDGGNSFYKDTTRRFETVKEKGIHFLGCGVSGGQEGALHGPSLMPGGSKTGYNRAKKILKAIAAKDFQGNPCVTYIGDNGTGHYVKMVHNGIEYAIMQIIAESYHVLSRGYGMSPPKIAKIFDRYTQGRLSSFLLDISVEVLRKKDDTKTGFLPKFSKKAKQDTYLINNILDKASQNGTGKWASLDALNRGVPVPTITQAVYARYISAQKDVRKKLDNRYDLKYGKPKLSKAKFIEHLERALYLSVLSSFSQGFALISHASEQESWKIDLAEVSRIWQGGCIIRAKMLKDLHKEFNQKNYKNAHVFLSDFAQQSIKNDLVSLRKTVSLVTASGIPLPGLGSSLFYIESMLEERLPANMIQGLRDYFGAHTYERIDKKGAFHTDWT